MHTGDGFVRSAVGFATHYRPMKIMIDVTAGLRRVRFLYASLVVGIPLLASCSLLFVMHPLSFSFLFFSCFFDDGENIRRLAHDTSHREESKTCYRRLNRGLFISRECVEKTKKK